MKKNEKKLINKFNLKNLIKKIFWSYNQLVVAFDITNLSNLAKNLQFFNPN